MPGYGVSRYKLYVTLIIAPGMLLAGVFYCTPAYCQKSTEIHTWQYYLAAAEDDVKLCRIFGFRLPLIFPLDASRIARGRANFLEAIAQAQESIPPLGALNNMQVADQMDQLGSVYALITDAKYKAAFAAHLKGKATLPLLKESEADATKLLRLYDKCLGKDSPKLVPLHKAVADARTTITRLEAEH